MVHIRFEGRSLDVAERELRLTAGMGDDEIKRLVADRLDVGVERLKQYVIDRAPNGNIVVRPVAVYG
jgi:hypothetical protein